tara:strand:- start:972 stop:1799 length:828 start_codon:yes stop_codon:yes gene_type:complete
MKNNLAVFQGGDIRRKLYKGEWYFSVVDVIHVLTDSPTPRQYWGKVKSREFKQIELSPIWVQLKLQSKDGKSYSTDCANTKAIFRIIQSIPSKKAEPFKKWLAKVGYERVQEIENPEIGQNRVKKYYELKGYPKDWIDKRIRGIAIRQELTDEWKNREVQEEKEFAILTNEISKATFDKNVKEYKKFKRLKGKNQNLRDHMNDWELILTMIGEKATTDITTSRNSKGFKQCKASAISGGSIAKNTRKEIEQKTGKKIISHKNYLGLIRKKGIEKK